MEYVGDRHTVLIEASAITRRPAILDHVPDAGLVRIQSGEQRRARRTAATCVVELREAHAAGRKCVDVRRRNLAAIAPDVGEAHVVDEDDDDIRLLRIGRTSGKRAATNRDDGGQAP